VSSLLLIKMSWIDRRQKIIEKIRQTFIEADKKGVGLMMHVLISEICINNGASRRIACEYIQILIDSGFIRRNGDELWLLDKSYKNNLDAKHDAL